MKQGQPVLWLNYSTIKLYLCGVRHNYLLLGSGDILKDVPRLNLTLRGIKTTQTALSRIRLPITTDDLYWLGATLSKKDTCHEEAMLWAACASGFMGHCDVENLRSKGISFQRTICVIRIFHFNTIQTVVGLCCSLPQDKQTDPFKQGVSLSLYATGSQHVLWQL